MEVKEIAYHKNAEKNSKNKLGPDWPFRIFMVGPSGSGKTTVTFSMILNDIDFDYLIVCSASVDGEMYEAFRELIAEREERIGKVQSLWVDNLNDVPDPIRLNRAAKTLVLFDDMLNATNKEKEKITKYYTQGRHNNASVINMMQYFTKMPPASRDSVNMLVLFKGIKKDHLKLIWEEFGTAIHNKKNFFAVIKECLDDNDHGFLVFDKTASSPHRKIRFMWDNMLDPSLLPFSEDY